MSRHAHRPSTPEVAHLRPHVAVVLMAIGTTLAVLSASAPLWWPTPAAPPRPAVAEHSTAAADGARDGGEVDVDPRRALTLRGLTVLRRWDARRAAAYAEADPDRLHTLYTPASAAGRRDRALLARYAERGLVVRGVLPQIRSVAVIAHGPRRLRVEVQERYPRPVVEREDRTGEVADLGGRRESRWRSRAVELRRSTGGWRVATVERA